MPDSQETRVLKDINRHLKNIDEASGDDPDISGINKNTEMAIGNFSSLIDARLKQIVLQNDRMFNATFGELQGFSVEQNAAVISELGEVIRELEMGNAHAEAFQQNEFLKEKERKTDLNINRRTNDLLEDILDQDEKTAVKEKVKDSSSIKGFLGGLLGGRGLSGVLGGIGALGKKVAKKLFLPALAVGAGIEFLRGWTEAGDDASVRDKFNSGISRTLSDLTFGLVSKEFFENMLNSIEDKVVAAWKIFKTQWDDWVSGEIGTMDFIANLLSELSFGTLSPEQIKKAGSEIGDAMLDALLSMWTGVTNAIFGKEFMAEWNKLVTNPLGWLMDKILLNTSGKEEWGEDDDAEATVDKLIAKRKDEADRKKAESAGLDYDEIKKEQAAQKLERLKFEQTKGREIGWWDKYIRKSSPDIKVPVKESATTKIENEAIEWRVRQERALLEAVKRTQEGGGGTLNQVIDNSQTYSAPPASFTETDDINLRMFGPRTSVAPFTR